MKQALKLVGVAALGFALLLSAGCGGGAPVLSESRSSVVTIKAPIARLRAVWGSSISIQMS